MYSFAHILSMEHISVVNFAKVNENDYEQYLNIQDLKKSDK